MYFFIRFFDNKIIIFFTLFFYFVENLTVVS